MEKIVDQKRKKEERAQLIEKLKEVQVSEEELKKMTSISQVQTKGIKRQAEEQMQIKKIKE